MKTALFLALVSLLCVCAHAEKTIVMKVDGMVCAFCSQGIEKKLRAEPATRDTYVTLQKKTVLVALKDGQDISDDVLKQRLTDAGYSVRDIARSDASFDQLKGELTKK